MKKSSSKSLTFALALSMATIILALPSCKCLDTVVQNGSQLFNIVQRSDTVVVRDSIYISEKQRGDTVYLSRIEFRDRWRTQIVHDTVVKTDSIVHIVEHPPKRYIPPFYKRCTVIFWMLIIAIIVYIICKIKLPVFHL